MTIASIAGTYVDPPGSPHVLTAARTRIVLLATFLSGMTVLAVEITASRLLAPFFGTSTIIWAIVIGLTLLYLSVGYWIGGRTADSNPNEDALYLIIASSGFLTGLIPFLAAPVLALSSDAIATVSGGLFFGSLVGVLLLFAVPLTMMGMVSPFAIRLVTRDVRQAGRRAGQVYALSTIGSILGAFLPVLVLVPSVGTRSTFLIFAVGMVGIAALATPGRSRRLAYAGMLIALIVLWIVFRTGSIRPHPGLVYETESSQNFIQVIDDVTRGRRLVLNEGVGTHSIYNSTRLLTDGPWDYFLVAPLLTAPTANELDSLLVVGLGAGTVSKQFTAVYGARVGIDGVELDPTIAEIGRRFFDMNEPNLTVIEADGRTYLQHTKSTYDVIAVDAYRQPYIPFHLTTQEFFAEARDRLNQTGVLALNAGRTSEDYRLVEVLSSTMRSVFPYVYVLDLPFGYTNSLVYGALAPVDTDTVKERLLRSGNPDLIEIATREWLLRSVESSPIVYTDDLAPVERLIDDIIVREAIGGAGRAR